MVPAIQRVMALLSCVPHPLGDRITEAGLYCSFAEKGVTSAMAKAAGISLPEMFASAIHQSRTDPPLSDRHWSAGG